MNTTPDPHADALNRLFSEVATANQKADANNETNKYILEHLRVMNGRGADHERRISATEGRDKAILALLTLNVAVVGAVGTLGVLVLG